MDPSDFPDILFICLNKLVCPCVKNGERLLPIRMFFTLVLDLFEFGILIYGPGIFFGKDTFQNSTQSSVIEFPVRFGFLSVWVLYFAFATFLFIILFCKKCHSDDSNNNPPQNRKFCCCNRIKSNVQQYKKSFCFNKIFTIFLDALLVAYSIATAASLETAIPFYKIPNSALDWLLWGISFIAVIDFIVDVVELLIGTFCFKSTTMVHPGNGTRPRTEAPSRSSSAPRIATEPRRNDKQLGASNSIELDGEDHMEEDKANGCMDDENAIPSTERRSAPPAYRELPCELNEV